MSADEQNRDEDPLKKLKSEAELRAAEAAVQAAVSQAGAAASRAGEGLLDALEAAIFGKVGGADQVLRKDRASSALDRLRAQYGASGDEVEAAEKAAAPPPVVKPDPVAKARAELERLKAEAAAPRSPPPEVKKTL